MKLLTQRLASKRFKPGRIGGLNLWRQWVTHPKALRWLLRDEDLLRPDDTDIVQGWSERQLEWGMHVRLHDGASGLPQVVEVLGPDQEVPHVLVYRVGEEVQVDESQGESRRCISMTEALEFVTAYT